MSDRSRLRSQQLGLRYPGSDRLVVEDADLDVIDGKVTTIIGPNGCGKSTVLRALGRLLRPTAGSVVLDGELIHRLPSKDVARRLGLLTQQPIAPQGITVEDLVYRGRYPHLGFFSAPAAQDDAVVEAALAAAGVCELRDRPIDSLSGGQRQRAWIAMALAQDTELILMDEPTTFLDLNHQLEVMELVRQLKRDGKTILLVLHDLNQAAGVSDHIVAMREGRIVRSGTPHEVIDTALLNELYEVTCDVFAHPVSDHPVIVPYGTITGGGEGPSRQTGTAEHDDPVVQIRGLSTGYQRRAAVSHDLTLSFPRGAITTLVGPNGCGKSTLLRTVARLLKPLGGVMSFDDRDARSMSRKQLARQLAMVMQGNKPPAGFLVEDIAAAGRTAHQRMLHQWSETDAAAITTAIDTCGLTDLRHRECQALSGGQMQRAWIAMALAQDTPLLFLDEPTTFLDIGYQVEVLDLVAELNRTEGTSVVMVLHDLNLAARYSDHMVVMDAGRIVASGPPEQIVTEQLVRDVFGVESRIVPDRRGGRPVVLPVHASNPASIATPPHTAFTSSATPPHLTSISTS